MILLLLRTMSALSLLSRQLDSLWVVKILWQLSLPLTRVMTETCISSLLVVCTLLVLAISSLRYSRRAT